MLKVLTLILALMPAIALAQAPEEPEEKTGLPREQNAALNPLPVLPAIPTPEVPYDPQAWTPPNDLLLPPQFIWERGGWTWNSDQIQWRLGDRNLAWRPQWTKQEGWNKPLPKMEKEDILGDMVPTTDFSGWLPADPAFQCEGLLALMLGIKIHRITLLPYESEALENHKSEYCAK